MFGLALVLSVVGLALGPALVALGRGRAITTAVIEGLTLGLVPLLIVTRLLPHVMEDLGPLAIGLAVAGYVVLWLVERRHHDLGDRVGQAVIIPTLALHALSDGAGLSIAFAAASHDHHGSAGALVALAIVMHRVPEGLFIATRLLPSLGWPTTLRWLGLLAATTVLGALAGRAFLEHVPETLFDAVVAFGLGAMIRMVMHAHSPAPSTGSARAASGAAFLVGIAVVIALPSPDDLLILSSEGELAIKDLALPLFLRTAPYLLMGLIAAGVVRSFLQNRAEGPITGGGALSQLARGLLRGLALPSYAGRAVPHLRRLLAEGTPPAAAAGFVLAALSLDIAGAALIIPLLGVRLAAIRVLAGVVISIVVALSLAGIVGGGAGRAAATVPGASLVASPAPLATRVAQGVRDACTTALDSIGAWYIAGIVLAAAVEAALPSSIGARAGAVDPLFGALLAIPVPVLAPAATPIAAVLGHKGLSSGAVLALLAAAPAASLAVLSTFRKALGLGAAATFSACVLVCAVALGLLANSLLSVASIPDLHAIARSEAGLFHYASAGLLAALLVASVLRLGPREWLARMSADLTHPHVGCHASSAEGRH